MAVTEIDLFLRSPDAGWCYDKWEFLPDDGNLYEVIDGVLYMSTAPSFRHVTSVIRLIQLVGTPLEARGLVRIGAAPVGVLMTGADPVQPDFLLIRSERAGIIA